MHLYWRHKEFESLEAYKQLVRGLPGYAIFRTAVGADEENQDLKRRKAHPNGTPVSWVQLGRSNSMGNTFTIPEYRRRGLAQVVTLALANHVIRLGSKASVYICDENKASILFHERLGFGRKCAISWQPYS